MQITGKWTAKQCKVAMLVSQVKSLQAKFTVCNPMLVPRYEIIFAFKLARDVNETCLICFPNLSRNPETISGFPKIGIPENLICPEILKLFLDFRKLGFPKIWFGIGIQIGIPEKFGLGIGTRISVWDPIPNHP
ncbi:hypothetical protein TB2_027751 [Malus domestica]